MSRDARHIYLVMLFWQPWAGLKEPDDNHREHLAVTASLIALTLAAATVWLVVSVHWSALMAVVAVILGAWVWVATLLGVALLFAGEESWPTIWKRFRHTVTEDFDGLLKRDGTRRR